MKELLSKLLTFIVIAAVFAAVLALGAVCCAGFLWAVKWILINLP